jgi:BlaI family penicillinase repressor
MKQIPKISEAEWEVMRVVWAHHPVGAADIIEKLSSREVPWHHKTIQTLMGRLVQKGALGYKPQGRGYVYSPLVTELECVTAVSESFLDRMFGGSLKPMLAHFVQQRKLSKKEIEELKRLLDGKD